LAFEKF